jgi:hypothetical protein
MLVDPDSVRRFGATCAAQATGLSAAANTLRSVAGDGAIAAFGPVGSGFLAALEEAVATAARAIDAIGADLADAHPISAAAANAYVAADRRGSSLL